MAIDLNASYDEGRFDKDEQGFCHRYVELRHVGDTLVVRRHGDDNGLRPFDTSQAYRVGEVLEAVGLVRLFLEHSAPALYFDLNTRRLVMPTKQVLSTFRPPTDYVSQAAREALAAALVPVAEAVGIPDIAAPPALPLGELRPSATAQGAVEATSSLTLGTATWSWTRRTFPDDGSDFVGPEQLAVDVSAEGRPRCLASGFVQSKKKATILVEANLERLPAAAVAVERAIAAWTRSTS